MMNCKLTKLALVMGVALSGVGLLPSAQALNVSSDNLGQALIFPYYSVRGGWTTLLGVTNTTDRTVAVKVRFREAVDSRDVLDFVVVLSPQDLWNATVYDDGKGPVLGINADENTCTVGLPSKTVPFPTVNGDRKTPISYDGDVDRMREGYMEIIMMGAFQVAGTEPDCDALTQDFLADGMSYTTAMKRLNTAFASYPDSPLKGTYSLVNGQKGYNAVGLPTALARFRSGPLGAPATPVMTLQLPPTLPISAGPTTDATLAYQNSWNWPNLNSATSLDRYYTAAGVDQQQALNAPTGVSAVTYALQAVGVLNEWTRNPTGQAAGGQSFVTATDWVVSFPTKNFYVDASEGTKYAQYSAKADPTLGNLGPAPFTTPYTPEDGSCDTVYLSVYDREENTIRPNLPSPGNQLQICHEVNVLTFNNGAILTSPDAVNIPYDPSFLYGWMKAGFGSNLPAIGFAITSRQSVDALLTEAALYNHSIVRP